MPGADRKRQKKLEKSRKKRELVKKQARKRELQYQGASLLRLAQAAPFGPAWVSTELDEVDEGPPGLVTVVITRRLRGLLLPEVVLIDRTCLGAKNAMLLPLMVEENLLDRLSMLGGGATEFRECAALEAQSVVFHALDYARSLGFGAHPDFEIALFEPRPESLLDTPLAKPERPMYITGPDDKVSAIAQQLETVVGAGNFDLIAGLGDSYGTFSVLGDEGIDFDEDSDTDEESDDDAIETTGESSGE